MANVYYKLESPEYSQKVLPKEIMIYNDTYKIYTNLPWAEKVQGNKTKEGGEYIIVSTYSRDLRSLRLGEESIWDGNKIPKYKYQYPEGLGGYPI